MPRLATVLAVCPSQELSNQWREPFVPAEQRRNETYRIDDELRAPGMAVRTLWDALPKLEQGLKWAFTGFQRNHGETWSQFRVVVSGARVRDEGRGPAKPEARSPRSGADAGVRLVISSLADLPKPPPGKRWELLARSSTLPRKYAYGLVPK